MLVITVYEDVTEHMERERNQRLLGRVGELLANSLTYTHTLERVAEACAPGFADLVAIDLLEDGLREHAEGQRSPGLRWYSNTSR